MKVLLAVCLVGIVLLLACGGGPTAPADGTSEITPAVTPYLVLTPLPCRPYPKCLH